MSNTFYKNEEEEEDHKRGGHSSDSGQGSDDYSQGVGESIARIEEQVSELKDMFGVMMSSAKVMTNRIERRLKKIAVKSGVAQRRKLK